MWNFARSAEKLFSRWAIKRFCKFWLKKKLGKFILGDIDLDQLDVQARAGIIQLSDLALNVDYLNQKVRACVFRFFTFFFFLTKLVDMNFSIALFFLIPRNLNLILKLADIFNEFILSDIYLS